MVTSTSARQACALLLTAALGLTTSLSSCTGSPWSADAGAPSAGDSARPTRAIPPLTQGNAVTLLDSATARRDMLDAVERARDHIHLATVRVDDDRLAAALMRQSRRGLAVHVICDGFAAGGTSRALHHRLQDAGVKLLPLNPVDASGPDGAWASGERSHRKMLIVDGRTAFLSGTGIRHGSSGESLHLASHPRLDSHQAARDTDLRVRGPAVAEYQRLFMTAWGLQGGPSLPTRTYFPSVTAVGSDQVRAIGSDPQAGTDVVHLALLAAITSASASVRLTNTQFIPDPMLVDALEQAAQRGVRVGLLLPGRSDSWLLLSAGRAQYERLLRAGVTIHERRGELRHSRAALIDGEWAVVGSTNLDWRSGPHPQGLDTVVMGTGFGAQLSALFDSDLANADEIRLEAWDRRPVHQRLREALGWAWAHWF